MKTRLALVLALAASLVVLVVPVGRLGASARQLHRQPLPAVEVSGNRSTSSTCSTWPRSRPSRRGRGRRSATPPCSRGTLELRVDGSAAARRPDPDRHVGSRTRRAGRAEDDAARRGLRGPAHGSPRPFADRRLRRAASAGRRSSSAARDGAARRGELRTGDEQVDELRAYPKTCCTARSTSARPRPTPAGNGDGPGTHRSARRCRRLTGSPTRASRGSQPAGTSRPA